MLEFYRLHQLAHQKGLLRDKYIYRVLPEPPTPKAEGSRDLELPGPRPKYVSRHAFRNDSQWQHMDHSEKCTGTKT